MTEVSSVQIRCGNEKCKQWFNSPIFFGDMDSFDSSMLLGNTVQCPHCGTMTGCNKENMRVRSKGGGWQGADT